ncbi:DUF1330 domain-containing protein [Roseovarius ramblicola]|uniref:DUF1330 domain-containing protein n=1 Tax=Roseovarius ramblicola TaxID=2022336 RepID=A0ABV5I151_9RHOB
MSAYIIGRITITDPQDYAAYAEQTEALAKQFGGRFLVKGGAQTVIEGNCPDRHVIIAFPDRQAALDWYNSDEYRRILPLALSAASRDLVIVDGV